MTNQIPVVFYTLVLDGMPWIGHHYTQLRLLPFPWKWVILEGVAANVGSTKWCHDIPPRPDPRISNDGTTEYLWSIRFDPRIVHLSQNKWSCGKDEMCRMAMRFVEQESLFFQIDSDELWLPWQLERIHQIFMRHPERNAAYFWCRYFVGPDIIVTSRDTWGNNSSYEWLRVFKVSPEMTFDRHEPPVIGGLGKLKPFTHSETEKVGLVFDHMAYATEKSVAFKEKYYGRESGLYINAVKNWRRLQENTEWPVTDLQKFLPWVGPGVTADRI